MRVFIAGIMQGSHVEAVLHGQDYRERLTTLLGRYYPDSEIYAPGAAHRESLDYGDEQGRDVFMMHNRMCAEVDVVVAFLPEASMGTAIEIWEAFVHGRRVVTISPLHRNWVVRYCSHLVLEDLGSLEQALEDGTFQQAVAGVPG